MSVIELDLGPAERHLHARARIRFRTPPEIVRRTAPYEQEPGYSAESQLWFYGNIRLLHAELACVPQTFGNPTHSPPALDEIEREAERIVLGSRVLVCGVHNAAHTRAAVVPLRWGSPRIVVVSGGFKYHLGSDLSQEPFLVAQLWRERWDPRTDLIVSRRGPDKLPTYAHHNPSVDRLITLLARGLWPGLDTPMSLLSPDLPELRRAA